MSAEKPTYRTEHSVELPAAVVDEIAEALVDREAPTEDDARDLAFDRLDRATEFRAPSGVTLADAVAARLESAE